MALGDTLGDGNSQLRDQLLNQYQQEAPDFSGDASVLTERLSRKLAAPGAQPAFQPADFNAPEAPEPVAAKGPDLSSFGKPVEPTPDPSTDDLSSFGTPVAATPAPALGVTGQVGAAAKGLLRAVPEHAGSILQGTNALLPAKPVPDYDAGLIDELGQMKPDATPRDRAQLVGRALRTLPLRSQQMDFNAAVQRIARGSDPAEEAAKLRATVLSTNAEAAKPIAEQRLSQAGAGIKDSVDAAIPMTDQEKNSAGGMVGGAVGTAGAYLAASALMGPGAALALGAAGMGTSTAGATFEAAKAKGLSDEQAAHAAGWGGAIGAALGTLPLATVLRPITSVSSKLGSSGAAILAQHAIEGGAAFATVGEAQEYLLGKVAQQYYDPEKGYSPDAKRIITNLLAGAVLGVAGGLVPKPKPSDISSPDDIADFLRRAGSSRGITGPEPTEGQIVERPQLPPPADGSAPKPEGPGPTPPSTGGPGEAATPPKPEAKSDHQTLRDAGFSEQEIADMSPRARATRLEESKARDGADATEQPASATQVSPDKIVEATGKRDEPITATTVDDVLRASEVVKEPTPAQASAENYQHAHIELPQLGLAGRNGISVETGVGQMRRGTSPDGTDWEVRSPVAYGRIKGTKGADGQPLDIFIGPNPDSPHVFMIDQRHAGTENFDEHKILAGFTHPEAAMRAYKDSYSDDAAPRIGAVTALDAGQFQDWLANGDHTKSFSGKGIAPDAVKPAPEDAGPMKVDAEPQAETRGAREPTAAPRKGSDQPLSLLQFIASKGGVAPHSEIKALDLAGDHRMQLPGRSGFFSVVRPTGMSLDMMREAAEEAGYLKGDHNATSTIRHLLDAMDDEFNRGNPKHAEGEEGTKSKTRRALDQESSDHARQQAIDVHHDEIEADADYKHAAPDVKKRAAEIMADENLPLDDAVEQAAMRLVSEDADYAITPQLLHDTYGKDVVNEIQPKPASGNGVVAEPKVEVGKRLAAAEEKDQGNGGHVPDTRTQIGEEPSEVGFTPSQMRELLSDEQEQIVNMWHRVNEPEPDNASDHYKSATRTMKRDLAKDGLDRAKSEDELLDMLVDRRLAGGMVKATRAEVLDEHHQAIENVLGPMADKVQQIDITRAAEKLAEYPDMPPEIAFQYATIENAVNKGDLTVAQAEEAYGPEVKDILGTEREGAPRSSAHADEGRAEPRAKRAGGSEETGIVPRGGQTGGSQAADDSEAGNSEVDQQPDAGRTNADAGREAAGGVEPETAAGEGRAASRVSTAPEHTHNQGKPLDRNNIYPKVEAGASKTTGSIDETIIPLTMSADQFKEITDEWASLFEDPGQRTNLETKLKNGPFISLDEAQKRVDGWKAHAAAQGADDSSVRQSNNEKTVLSLFDLTGEWARPWAEAGYNVLMFDIQSGQDVHDFSVEYFNENYDFGDVYAILAATPCTDFAVSGAKHFAAKDADGRTEASKELVFQTLRTIEYFKPKVWALENPVGRIAGLTGLPNWRLLFNPNNFGAPYTKKTVLWGNFDENLPTANVDPVDGSKMWAKYGGKSQATKNARSETPEGFAYSFFMANNAADMSAEKRLTLEYPEASGAVKAALDAGVSEDRINELMENTYGNYEYEAARNALAREVHPAPTEPTTAGEQSVIPGAEKIGDGALAQRQADQPLKPAANQRPADDGLFGDGHRQTDLLDLKPQGERDGVPTPVSGGDAGPEPEDVPAAQDERGAGEVRPVEGERGASDVSGTDEERAAGAERPADNASGEGSRGGSEGDDVRVLGGSIVDLARGDERADGAGARAARSVKGENFHIDPGGLAEDRGPKEKAVHNLRAIRLAKELEALDRPATLAEQQHLSKYVGWGGIKGAFPDADGEFAKGYENIGAEIKDLLSPEEYDTARRSIQYAHYTSEDIIGAMWKLAEQLGFKGGKVFEPGMGVGNFPGLMPPDLAERTSYQGVELDHVSAQIAKLLYPKWGVRREDFTRMPLPENSFDMAIGNPPFASIAIQSDPKYKQGFLLHDYFFAKSLDAVRPGGLLMFVTSAVTMNKEAESAREYLADRAELVGAIRLPGNAFKKNAGTDVTTDIVILRKLMPGETSDRAWIETAPITLPGADGSPTTGRISSYFVEHPHMVLGKADFADKIYEGRYSVKAWDNFDLKDALAVAATKLPRNVMIEAETPQDRAEVDFDHAEKKAGTYYIDKAGDLRQMQEGAGVAVQRRGKGVEGGKTAEQIDRIRGLIPIRDALRATYAADLADDKAAGDRSRAKLNEAYDAFVAKYGPINKAEIQLRRPSVVQQEAARSEAREEARYADLPFEEGSFDPLPLIEAGKSLAEIARKRKEAREEAATTGMPFDDGSFDPDDMKDNIIDKRPNIEPFMDDQESYRLRAIEHYDDASQKASKGLVFSQNVITRERPPTINSISDAVLYVLNQRGRLDIGDIGALVSKSPSEVIEALGEKIYRVPGTKDTWETKEAYLSGNVRKKLALARKEAARDASLRRNVEALEANQPAPLAPAQISATLGMPWIPEAIVEQFAKDELGLSSFRAKYIPVLAQWSVSGDTDSMAATTTWGTSRRNATALMNDALNHVTTKIYDEDSDGNRTLNVTATQAAQEKMTSIKEAFKKWVFADDARADPMAAFYNENYNNLVVRQYDGDYLTTPGIATGWKWRPHQTRVISRIIQSGNTYMAHAVGAGKTSAMIGAGMEMRRLGLVKKPMYAVPNHMLGQFTKEFYEQYPTARIAVADERNFHADRRKQFMANIALDDLDAVIITHTNFTMIPVSDDFADEMIQDELNRYRNALSEMPRGQDARITRSRIEKQIERLEQRLSGKSNRRRDNVFNFDELGVDFLFVDEAHLFRKLEFATQMSIKGIDPKGSGMSWDLYVKTKLLEKHNPGRNLVLASGTPVTNTMAELYTISRYQQPAELAERNLSAFDAWAGAFGEEVSELEQDAAGGYKAVSRFAKFVNVAELSSMVRQFMDVVSSKQLEQYVTRPKISRGGRKLNLADKSQALADFQEGLAARMVAIKARGGKAEKGMDNFLTVINDGRHAAIDMRLVGGDSDPAEPSKLELMIDNVFETHKASTKTKFYRPRDGGYDMSSPADVGPATQMIFANLGISAKRGLPIHQYIRAELVRRGIPRDQIALISEFKTHVARQKLFNDMNAGKVRLMIGSVAKMGTGVNAQRRLKAIHNLDPLWYPSDDEQRNGRGLRQGNWNPELDINDYAAKGTYDSSMWGLMEKKARFIQGFFEGDPSMREMDDLGEASQYAQAKAMTTNDPRLMRLTELKGDLERADRRKSAFESERYALRRRQADARATIDHYAARVASIKQDIALRKDLAGDNFSGTVGKTVYDKRVEFGEAILAQIGKVSTHENAGRRIVIGDVSGFPIRVGVFNLGTIKKEVGSDLLLKRTGDSESTIHGTSAMGIARSIEGILTAFDTDLAYAQGRVDQSEKFLKDSAGKETATFQGNPEITALADQVRNLEADLAKKDETPPAAASRELPPPTPESMASVEPLTPAGAEKRAELERLLTAAVHRMAPSVKVIFHQGRIEHLDQGGWGSLAAQYKGVVGLYRPARQLIELSLEGSYSTAFHEAYHAIEHLLQTARERELMLKETARLRKILGDADLVTFSPEQMAELAGSEVRAVAFELYTHLREKFGAGQGLHVGVKRWYHRLADMTRQIKNGANGLGFKTAEDIFAQAFDGGFADRTPRLPGTPFPAEDQIMASVQNPFNGPLRDSVGEAIEQKLANKKERLIEGYQNLNRPVENLENIIEARMAGEIPDSQAFYQKKRLFPGKVGAEANDFNQNLLDPAIDYLKSKGITREQAGDILYALHAPERNREMDKINMDDLYKPAPDMVLGRGSGMSNATAAEILSKFPTDVVAQIDQMARNINRYIGNMMVQSGLESAGTVAGWNATYDHYVPLAGWEDAPDEAPKGRGPANFTVRGPEVRKAFGRTSKADNPLVNLIDQAYRTIERAKKNEYLQSLDNALHELEPEDQKNFVRFDQGKPKKVIDKRTGLVKVTEDSNFRNDPGAVAFKRGGNVHYVILENAQLADTLKRMHADGLGVLQPLIDIQNKLKATWTHYSPEFLIRHFLFRYPIEGVLNSFEQKEGGEHSVGRYIADAVPFLGNASKAIFASNKGTTHANPDVVELQNYWQEMRKAGGAMMFRQMRDTNLLREHMQSKLNSLTNSKWSNFRAKWQGGVEAMDVVTNALDNSLRLAAYASARKQGKTPEQAAIIARDATVDFQQSGRWKNAMSLWAPFSGVAINTGARMESAVARSRIMKQVFGATVLAGFLSGMFNYLIGGDDKDGIPFADKLAWWQKALTFTVLNPFDRDEKGRPQPIWVPMPYNWAFPMMIGQTLAAMAFTKDKHGVKHALGALLKSGLEALTPIGAEHNLVAQMTPELLRPIVHAYTNESWNGTPVHKDAAFQKGPRSESGRKTTGEGWKWAAQGLNTASGGDSKHSGVVDIYPEDLRDVLSYYSGSDTIMRFGRNVAGSIGHAAAGEPQEPSRIPFVRVIRGTDYDAADRSRKFDRIREEKQPWTR